MAVQTGRVAYEGYSHRARGVSLVTGDELPGWDDLDDKIRKAWQAAADAVQKHVDAGRPAEAADGGDPVPELKLDAAHEEG